MSGRHDMRAGIAATGRLGSGEGHSDGVTESREAGVILFWGRPLTEANPMV
jgi:hypothetical protein